jgi:hypothetical protein
VPRCLPGASQRASEIAQVERESEPGGAAEPLLDLGLQCGRAL